MKKASTFFTNEELQRINDAVTAAEKTTSGEIVPVLATDSGDYDRAEDIGGLWLAFIILGAFWYNFQGVSPTTEWSNEVLSPSLGFLHILVIFIPSFVIGAWLTSKSAFFRNLLAGRKMMHACVQKAAAHAFYKNRVRDTLDGTGILIYVSIFERMVCVLGDDGIAKHLDQNTWDEVRDLILAGFKKGDPCQGFCAGIAKCGEILTPHFPIKEDDTNELSNALVVID